MTPDACSLNLRASHCEACRGGTPPLTPEEYKSFLVELAKGWNVVDEKQLLRTFTFPDFKTALDFVDKVGAEAEAEQHHPDIELGWGKVSIHLWTHKVGGLSRNDFILAAKIDALHGE